MVNVGSAVRVDSTGWPACEKCGTRLSRVKHHRPHGAGRACTPRCKPSTSIKQQSDATLHSSNSSSSSSAPSKPTHKRKSQSEPGQQSLITHNRLRVRAPKPIATNTKKTKQEKEAEILALLDRTHARRMALLAAAAASSSSSSPEEIE